MPRGTTDDPGNSPRRAVDPHALFVLHRDAMVRLAYLLISDRDAAQDIAHDAFAGFLARGEVAGSDAAAAAYLRTSVVNKCRSTLRRRLVAKKHLIKFSRDDPPAAPDAKVIASSESEQLTRIIERLPHRQREVIVLRYWNELSESEIAATLGVSTGTVKTAAHRARRTIRARLEQDDD